MEEIAVHAAGLRKRFGEKVALDGLDLEVPAGTVHGLLGPNGAGKTTAVRILSTLLSYDEGSAAVTGLDLRRRSREVRARIGLVGQNAAVDEELTGRQNLAMFGRLYHLGGRAADRRADDLLERFGLSDAARRPVRTYSGGMRRRLDLAAGLIVDPAVLFLDEPTTGLDPRGRTEIWAALRTLVSDGTTVLLTTQYLEEADQLASALTVIDAGRVIARGSPASLKSQVGGDRLELVLHSSVDPADAAAAASIVEAAASGPVTVTDRRVSAPVTSGVAALTTVARALHDKDIAPEDLAVRRPTLDDVFLTLTGHTTSAVLDCPAPPEGDSQ